MFTSVPFHKVERGINGRIKPYAFDGKKKSNDENDSNPGQYFEFFIEFQCLDD